ncbi:MAG: PKD domain-containing protein, partial [Saprospiraceae bacterium]
TVCKTSKVYIVTPVEANFTSEIQDGCTTLKVKYKNLSSDNSTSYQWSFPGGVPSISKEKEPTISYLSKGIFDTKLTVTNSKYTSTKYEKGFIRVDSKPISQFESKATVGNSIEFVNETIDTIAPWKYSYLWKFGDGMTSKEKSPTHNYSGTGKYNVCLITNNTCSLDTLCKEVEISAVLASSFSSNTSKGCAPFSVEFKNNSTGASRYLWNFPGGTPSTSTDPNPKVVYNLKGIYDVSLMAYSTSDSALAKQISYISINNLPIAKFGFTINKLKAQFNNQTINGTSYLWKFSDNTTSTEVNPLHDFKAEGEYNIELIAQNECGETRATFRIAIYLIPKVNFSASKTDICVGDHITLNNLSSIDVTDWNWQINGGAPATSIEKNPVVIFEKAGTYTIKLTVKNSNGENSITKTSYINVKSPVLCPKHKGKETKLVEGSESDESINAKQRIGSTKETLEILPNPSNGVIKVILPSEVNMQNSQIEISNVQGVKKLISKLNVNNDHQLDLDLSQEPSGVYLITVYNDNEVISKKFVIVN